MRDSSLSAATQAVIAAEVGHLDLAHDYLAEAALMDLRDLAPNTRDGLHMPSLAGTWIALVAGFGGMRDHGHAVLRAAATAGADRPPLRAAVPRRPAARGDHRGRGEVHPGIRRHRSDLRSPR